MWMLDDDEMMLIRYISMRTPYMIVPWATQL